MEVWRAFIVVLLIASRLADAKLTREILPGNMLPANPILSSASLPRAFTSTPTITELFERDTIVTVSVVASTAATSSSPPKKATAFPFAVAIPALVGGMALAVGAFLLYWWIGRKKKREKRVNRLSPCARFVLIESRNDGSERNDDSGNRRTLRPDRHCPPEIRLQARLEASRR